MYSNYFNRTDYKEWSLSQALIHYDSKFKGATIQDICLKIRNDLEQVKKRVRKGTEFSKAVEDLSSEITCLQSLQCIKSEMDKDSSGQADETQIPVATETNFASTLNQTNYLGTHSSQHKQKKRKLNKAELSSNDGSESPSVPHPAPLTSAPQQPAAQEDAQVARNLPDELVLSHNQKKYCIRTPSFGNKSSPHRPKLTKSYKESIQEYFQIATSYAKSADPETVAIYEQEELNQRTNQSLVGLGLFGYVNGILRNFAYVDFPEHVWASQVQGLRREGAVFLNTIKYVLTGSHLLFHAPAHSATNHERTFFVEFVILGLLALSKTSELARFYWCESKMQAVKEVNMEDREFNHMKTSKRYWDALGKMATKCEMEAVIIKLSSGPLSENVTHSIEDTLKIYECATASLKTEALKYKDASIDTFKELQVFSIHVIKNVMTLCATMLNDAYTWKHVQLRTVTIPDKWDDRLKLLRYFELLATLMNGLRECAETEKKLDEQHLGSAPFEGRTVREVLDIK